jgi:CubicO group peptidase (beta-lactamase class C family)
MTAALAAQEPWWEPCTGHGYHVNTFGFLVGEIIRRRTGSTVGTMLRDEIAGPLGADVHSGLPVSQHFRAATFAWPGSAASEDEPSGLEPARLIEHNAYFNPCDLSGAGMIRTRSWRAAEVPSANAHGTARGVARVYAALAAGGTWTARSSPIPPPWRPPPPSRCAARTWCCRGVALRPGFQLTQPRTTPGPRSLSVRPFRRRRVSRFL